MFGNSQGDYLNEQADYHGIDEWDHKDLLAKAQAETRAKLCKRYTVASEAKIGTTIHCPVCNKAIVKTTYHKIFCSNGKTRKGGNCKDKYWNRVDENRSFRAKMFM